jgi:hypothetical protein
MTHRTWFLAAAVFWTVAIFVGTWLPPEALPHSDLEQTSLASLLKLDKIVHALMFTGFAFLWLKAHRGPVIHYGWVIGLGVMVAIATEVGQSTPWVRRDGDAWDALADIVGLIVGTLLYKTWGAEPRTLGKAHRPEAVELASQEEEHPPEPEPLTSRRGA